MISGNVYNELRAGELYPNEFATGIERKRKRISLDWYLKNKKGHEYITRKLWIYESSRNKWRKNFLLSNSFEYKRKRSPNATPVPSGISTFPP